MRSAILVVVFSLMFAAGALAAEDAGAPAEGASADERIAHAIYDRMLLALREAETLYYESEYSTSYGGGTSCRVWLKKPNYVRIEAPAEGDVKGVLVGDGLFFWTYWPGGRPKWHFEDTAAAEAEYEKYRMSSFMKEPAPPGGHSISHKTGYLGAGLGMLITNPSNFHGCPNSMQGYLEGVRSLGEQTIGDEECFVVEVNYMRRQRQRHLWISKRDFLPRLQREYIHVSRTITIEERWRNIIVDGEIPDEKFRWTPPEGWREFRFPEPDEGLLAKGSEAPDFDFPGIDGGRIRLSDLRGKVIWLNVWRAG